MTISATSPLVSYAGNGTSTAFAVTFQFLLSTDLVVALKNNSTGVVTIKTLTTHYTVTGGNGSTGTVTMLTAPAAGETLVIYTNMVFDQQTDYIENDKFPAQSHERALDKITMIAKQLLTDIGRSMRIPTASSVGINTELPAPVSNHVLAWNASGAGLTTIDPATFATIGAAGSFTVDQFSGTGAQTAFTLSRAPGLENNTYVYVSGVYVSKLAYSISGDVITFAVAPAVGTNNIEVCQSVALTAGTPADGTVSVASLSTGFSLPYTMIASTPLQTLGAMPSARATDVAGLSAYIGGLLNDADAATARTTLGAGTGDGTVTGVTGASPVASSGGTSPVISMAAATASNAGHMTTTYAAKLDGIAAGATVGVLQDVGAFNVGCILRAGGTGGAGCASNATIAGSGLRAYSTSDGVVVLDPTLSGTWRNIGASVVGSAGGVWVSTFQRIA